MLCEKQEKKRRVLHAQTRHTTGTSPLSHVKRCSCGNKWPVRTRRLTILPKKKSRRITPSPLRIKPRAPHNIRFDHSVTVLFLISSRSPAYTHLTRIHV